MTYGCQMNFSDSERIASVLEKIGYKPELNPNKAHLIAVNMCSVRQSAVDRVYGQIKNFSKLKKKNPKLKTLLTGCILKSDFKKFSKTFDYILDKKNLLEWQNCLKRKKQIDKQLLEQNALTNCSYFNIKPKYTNNFSAYIPIILGCNNFCSYCVVPYTRGREISRPAKDILKEIKNLVKKNYKEIWLLGENVNSYYYQSKNRNGKPINFSQLLQMIDDIPGNFWIRFTSSHPKDFSDELIKTIVKGKKITKYISLPVQSGDAQILKKMNRPYTIKEYKNLIKKIRRKIPDAVLSTDVIVGFPKETKKQFQNTIKLFKEIKPDMAYIAQYSPRQSTAAYKIKDNLSLIEKQRREKILTKVLEQTALENNKKYIGKIVEALIEYERKSWFIGKTKEYKTIKFQFPLSNPQNLIGKIIKIKVVGAIPWGLKGVKI